MSVVRINVLQVPQGRGDVLEQRFASRAGEVEHVDGFESFELLRPTDGTDRYLVVTRWRDDAAFRAWVDSPAFRSGHARARADAEDGAHAGGRPGADAGPDDAPSPAAIGSELWSFEIVASATAAAD